MDYKNVQDFFLPLNEVLIPPKALIVIHKSKCRGPASLFVADPFHKMVGKKNFLPILLLDLQVFDAIWLGDDLFSRFNISNSLILSVIYSMVRTVFITYCY